MRSRRLVGTVFLAGSCFILVAGVLALAAGVWMIVDTSSAPELRTAEGQTVTIPEGGFLRDSVPVYADTDTTELAAEPGCELTGASAGDSMRVDDLFFATGDEITVDGVTWYPLVEVSVDGDASELRCPGLPDTAAMAVGDPRAFGSWIKVAEPTVLLAGPLFILVGLVGAVVGVLLRRSARPRPATPWQG